VAKFQIEGLKRPARIFSWSIGIAAISVAVLEISLRLVLGLGTPVLYVAGEKFGYFPKGNQHLHRFFVDIDTDRFGMRSTDVPDEKQAGEYRLLFVGDSVAFGTTYVDQRDIFVSRIQRNLAQNGNNKISVMNGSAPGWAPSNELGFIKSQGIHHADMVVMVYNTKDLDQPFTPFVESPLTPLRPPRTAISETWSRYIEPRVFKVAVGVDPGSTSSEGPPAPELVDSVMQTIAETRRLAVSNGARFVILYTPAVLADVSAHQADWDTALTQLKNWAKSESVPLIDMTPAFSAHGPKEIYFDGIHLRPLGDEIVADEFVSFISAQLPKIDGHN
jgi:hypothetical protein